MQPYKLIPLIFFLTVSVYSQQSSSKIGFEADQFNFGKILESDGKVQHDFVFTNKGQDPLIITNVKPSGGVSVLQWTRSPVIKGEAGTITVEFNPVNMPGRFNRSITVYSNGTPSTVVLRLLGEVIPREKTPMELYPQEIGSLRLRSNHISFGHLPPGSKGTDTLKVINLSEENLDLTFTGIPRHITIAAIPGNLKPGEEGIFIATYDASEIADWGTITHNFRVLVNGVSHGRNIIYLSANIQEDFTLMSDEERKQAASIDFDNRVFDFGKLTHGETIEHDFVFTNNGLSDLVIRRVRSGCGCTAIEPQKTLLAPGESSSIRAVFSSKGFRGRQNKGITVITNDPANPNIVLRITGEVIAD
ncbi:MAG: DUF1573 domain-containing protein [Bacteroidales bacterium]